jgi:hypothetical protein
LPEVVITMSDRWSSALDQPYMLDLYRHARTFYRDQLIVRPYEWAARHLRHHGLGHAMEPSAGWRVGYAPDEPSYLVQYLRWLEFVDEDILASGSAVPVMTDSWLIASETV